MSSQKNNNTSSVNSTNFIWPCSLPVARIGAFFSDGTMITVEHQPPPASIRSPSSCLKGSLCQIHTLPQSWGYSNPFSEPANWHVQLMQRCRRCHALCMHAGSATPLLNGWGGLTSNAGARPGAFHARAHDLACTPKP